MLKKCLFAVIWRNVAFFWGEGEIEVLCKKKIKIIRSARRRFHAKLIYNAKNCLKLRSKTTERPRKWSWVRRQTYRTPQRGPDTSSKKKAAEVSENWKFCDFVRCADYNLVADGCRAVSSSVCSKESTKDERKESSRKGSAEVLRSNLYLNLWALSPRKWQRRRSPIKVSLCMASICSPSLPLCD